MSDELKTAEAGGLEKLTDLLHKFTAPSVTELGDATCRFRFLFRAKGFSFMNKPHGAEAARDLEEEGSFGRLNRKTGLIFFARRAAEPENAA